MKTKPFATLPVVFALALLLCTTAQGGVTFPDTISVVPQPFWSTLRIFRSEPKVSLILLVPTVTQSRPDYAAVNTPDLDIFAGFNDNSDKTPAPIFVIPLKPEREQASVPLEPAQSHRSTASLGPSLADTWSRTPGVGSTIPTYDTGFGSAEKNTKPDATRESAQSQFAGNDLRPTDQFSHAKATVTGPDAQSIPLAGADKASQSFPARSSVSIAGITITSDASKLGGARQLTPKALSGGNAPDAVTAIKTWDGQAGTAQWEGANNWNPNGVPGSTDSILLDNSSVGALPSIMNTSGLTMSVMGITFDTANTVTLGNSGTGSGATSSITLTGLGDAGNTLISLTNNATGTFTIDNQNSGNRDLTLTLGASGTLNVTNALGTLAITTVIGETGGTRSITKTGAGTLILGSANTYTGTTTVSAGVLNIQNATALGTTTNGTTVGSSATLQMQGGITTGAEQLTISGTGASGQNGALVNVSGTNSYGGQLILGAASTISSDSGILNLTNSATITGAGFNLTLTGAGDGSILFAIGTGSGGVIKSGAGTWTLSGSSTYTGATTINAGILKLGAAGGTTNTPLGTTASGTTVSGTGAALDLNGFTLGTAEALTLNGTGVSGGGALTNTSATSVNYSGLVTLGSDSSIIASNGAINLTNVGTITGATFGLTLGGAGNGSVSSIIGTTSGGLTKSGAGTWTLSGANTYSGLTNISAGTLILNGSNSSAGATTVTSSGTLQLGAGANGGLASGLLSISGTIRSTDATARTVGNSVSLTSNSATFGSGGTGALTFNGTIDLGVAAASDRTISTVSNVTFTNVISGNSGSGLVKNGSGTLTFSGTSANTYDGLTTINLGELDLNKTAGVNAIAGNITIGDGIGGAGADILKLLAANQIANTSDVTINSSGLFNLNNNSETIDGLNGVVGASVTLGSGTLTIGANNEASASFAGVISGSGALVKTGTGAQTLSGANSYSGTTNINSGALNIQNVTGLGTTAAGTSVASGAALELQGGVAVGAEALTLNGTGVAGNGALRNVSGTNSYAGAITLGSASTITSALGTLTLTGGVNNSGTLLSFDGSGNTTVSTAKITGSGGLTKTGSGTLTLSFANDYTGLTTISAGTLLEGVSDALGTGALTINGSTAIFDLGASHNDTVGTVTLDGGGAINGSGTSALTSTGSFEMKNGSVSAILGGSGIALNKTTSGTVTLSGINTYTGTTTISAGTLSLSNAGSTNNIAGSSTIIDNAILNVTGLSGGAITLASGQTLKGGGTVTGGLNVNTGSFLAPGNSVGTLSSGNTAYNSGGTYTWEINDATGTAGSSPGWDWNNITGTLTIGSATFTIDVNGLNGATPGLIANFNKYASYDWDIATASSGISGFSAGKFAFDLTDFTNSISGTLTSGAFSITTSGNNLIVHYTGATDATPTTAYWTGDISSSWNTNTAGNTNWATSAAGTTDTHAIPGAGSDVYFAATGAANFTNTLGQDFSINSLNFISGSASYTINGNTLTLAAGINDASANAQTINSAIVLGADQTWANTSGNPFIVNGAISGAFGLTKTGSGFTYFGGANSYSGGTTINGGTLVVQGSGTLGSSSNALTVNTGGTLDLNATNQSVGALNGSGGLIKNSGSASILTVGNGGGSGSYAGSISNLGSIALVKTGSGTQTLTANNSYTGTTTINGGTLELANGSGVALSGTASVTVNNTGTLLFSQNNQINQASFPAIALNGGTIDAGGKNQGTGGTSVVLPGTVGLGALTLTSSSTIDLSSISVLHFGDSSGATWNGSAILSILNWNGTATTGGGSEQILFGLSPTGLTATQLTQIQFIDPAGFNPGTYGAIWALDGTGEIVPLLTPVPEPSTWLAAALALGIILWTQRRRVLLFRVSEQ